MSIHTGDHFHMEKTYTYRGIRPSDTDGRAGLRNPERGLRFEIGVGRCEDDLVKFNHVKRQWPFETYAFDGVTIAQAYCYLSQFYDTPISNGKIAALEESFAHARKDGVKFLLRFAYEFEGLENGPTAEQIIAHINQLKDILDRNWDVIYCLQSGWIGLWGEFHTSIHGLEKDIAKSGEIIRKTLEILPDDRFTMMRRYNYKKAHMAYLNDDKVITADTAFTQAPHAKTGFFNDGTLAGFNDGFTFPDPPYSTHGNTEFDTIAAEAPFMPVDGELFWTGQASNPADAEAMKAIERFRLHHYTTFSYVHGFSGLDGNPAPWTIDFWKTRDITPEELDAGHYPYSPDYFDGAPRAAFDYIRDHLGYRLEALESTITTEAAAGDDFNISLTLVNHGFSTFINPRKAFFVLTAPDGKAFEIETDTDCRTFQPYTPGDKTYSPLKHNIKASFVLPDTLPKGEYSVALWLPDSRESLKYRSDYAVRLANAIPFENIGGRGLNILGKATVK